MWQLHDYKIDVFLDIFNNSILYFKDEHRLFGPYVQGEGFRKRSRTPSARKYPGLRILFIWED